MSIASPTNMTPEQKASMGVELSAAAYAEPPIVPEGIALILIILILTLTCLTTVVIALRVYVRVWHKRSTRAWSWDDTFAMLGYLTLLASSIFAIKACFYGLGMRDAKLNKFLMVRCAEYLVNALFICGASMPLIKASVVFTLLRFTDENKFRWTLYAMQFAATTTAIMATLSALLYCRPVQAYWNPLLGKCGDYMVVVKIGYVWTFVAVVTDWCCSILPWFIVRKMQMSKRSKVTVMINLGLGSLASMATIARVPFQKYALVAEDKLYWNGHIHMWNVIEGFTGLIAISLPALRSLFITWIKGSRYDPGRRAAGNAESKAGVFAKRRIYPSRSVNPIPLSTLKSSSTSNRTNTRARKYEPLEDDSSSKGIVPEERTVNVESKGVSDAEAGNNHKIHNESAA